MLCQRVRQRSYPVVVKNGIVFAYLGEGEAPAFPDFDCFLAPGTHAFAFKGLIDCNWLQALEVGIDPAHASYLHRFYEDEDPSGAAYGKQFRAASADSDIPMTRMMREYRPADHRRRGHRLRPAPVHPAQDQREAHPCARDQPRLPLRLRDPDERGDDDHPVARADRRHVLLLVRDLHHASASRSTTQQMREQRLKLYELPDYRPRIGRHNNYGYDVAEQTSQTFTGMGFDINVHDQWAIESQGRIQDRTREHLGTSDKAIVAYRRMLLSAIGQVGERREAADVARRRARGDDPRPGHHRRHGPDRAAGRTTGRSSTPRRRSGSSWAAKTRPPLVA